jgi:hypothetical protein
VCRKQKADRRQKKAGEGEKGREGKALCFLYAL